MKLIKEYESKIVDQDKIIEKLSEQIKAHRFSDTKDYLINTQHLSHDRQIAFTKRQCYVQFIKDLESI